MRAAKYRHSCIVSEFLGYNDVTGLEDWADIYNGICLYQEQDNITIAGGFAMASPMVYLPSNDALFSKGMKCVITTTKGRVIETYIDNFVDYEGKNIHGTQLMLKQSRDEQ